MASFEQNLRTIQSGDIPTKDLFGEMDRILADGQADAANLSATLSKLNMEEAKDLLPIDACSTMREKLELLAQNDFDFVDLNEEELKSLFHDTEDTQLAKASQPKSHQVPASDKHIHDVIKTNNDYTDPIKGRGDVLNNRFELLECVGTGGMSAVYKAVDRRKIEADDRHPHVAVKVLNLEFRAHPDSLMALQREAKKCQSLAHPKIVRVYDFDRDGSTVYMTMEYLSGVSLARKMSVSNFRGLPQKEALRIINDAGQALHFAHDAGIVHADFKPANIFLTDDGKVKVIDFGIARAFQRDDAVEMEATRFDPSSLAALTPSYASPEMLEHKSSNPRDDIYALACVAYEMFTGRHPFGRVPATVACERKFKLKRHKALTRSQYKALKHALEFNRSKRTATVEQFLKEINRTTKVLRKKMTALGMIGVLVGASAGYYNLSVFGEGYFANTTITDRHISPPTTRDITKTNNQQENVEIASPLANSSSADLESEFDFSFWETIKNSKLAAEFEAYLESFPNGRFASEAKLRAAQLRQATKSPLPKNTPQTETTGTAQDVIDKPEIAEQK